MEMAQPKAAESRHDEMASVVDELPSGTKLLKGQYTITRFLNNGGFGITYLAKDSLNRNVVIKECFPNAFCRRSKTVVAARSRAHQAELRSVVQLFVREAHSLARLVHPNIVAVHQVFEDNGTAYMAIDYIDGRDLLEIIEDGNVKLTPEEVIHITEKMLSAVGFIHENDMLHRDISPDNILVSKHGQPILIDFGAAREQASRKSRALTALRVVKDGYSPQEFYIAGSEQGPWSDLYALGATLYHLISGEPPVNGQARLAALAENRPDPYQALFGRFAGYPPGFLEAIDRVMNTIPKNRLQSAAEWLAMFKEGTPPRPIDPDRIEAAVHQMIAEAVTPPEPPAPARPAEPPTAVSPPASLAASTAAPAGAGSEPLSEPVKPEPVKPVAVRPVVPARVSAPARPRFAPLPEHEEESVPAPAIESPRRSRAPVLAGIAIAAASASITFLLMGGAGYQVAQDAPPVVPAESAIAAAASQSLPAAAPVPSPIGGAATSSAPLATAPPAVRPALPASAEPLLPEDPAAAENLAAEPGTPVPADTGAVVADRPPAAEQIAFAAWDVRVPFVETQRMSDGAPVLVVSRIAPDADLQRIGGWIETGVMVESVNDAPVEPGATLAGMILNDLHVDPDGFARVAVGYVDAAGNRQTGLLAVPAVRMTSLVNGVTLLSEAGNGTWQTIVKAVVPDGVTTLQPGDVLFRDKTTGVPLEGPQSIEGIAAELVASGKARTDFSVVRGSSVETATMQLALEPEPGE
jgi:serine/threonine protein kinase